MKANYKKPHKNRVQHINNVKDLLVAHATPAADFVLWGVKGMLDRLGANLGTVEDVLLSGYSVRAKSIDVPKMLKGLNGLIDELKKERV